MDRTRRRVWAVLAILVGLVAAGCSDNGPSEMERTAASIVAAASATTAPTTTIERPSTTTPGATAATTKATTAAAGAPAAPAAPPPGLGTGARGPEVAALEKRLETLLYDVGKVDDLYDQNTAYGVTAFQKVNGLPRTGRATDDVIAAMATAKQPAALVPNGGENRVEIDIPRQVLFLYKSNTLQKIITISSGNNQRFCSEGWCRRAVTPGGSYGFYRQGRGWETGPLGSLYNPVYFNGGIAVHGSRSVPAQPASHGCIRIPMSVAEWFPDAVQIGMPVHVVGVDGQPPTPAAPATTPVTQPEAPIITPPSTPSTPPTTAGLLDGLLKPPTTTTP
jgi:peptidoglycan hydrolase-like protein with peptidoglycan-binding domain